MNCPECSHPDTDHSAAGCVHAGIPCLCMMTKEELHAERQPRTITVEDALAWHYSIPGSVLRPLAKERQRQNEKWGEQNHDDEIWLAILSEEIGEVSQALLHNKFGGRAKGTLREELVHAAAVAIQWLEYIDRTGGDR
jgi:NTP pyrophosphatase (non-canonical NTP hydrolase)